MYDNDNFRPVRVRSHVRRREVREAIRPEFRYPTVSEAKRRIGELKNEIRRARENVVQAKRAYKAAVDKAKADIKEAQAELRQKIIDLTDARRNLRELKRQETLGEKLTRTIRPSVDVPLTPSPGSRPEPKPEQKTEFKRLEDA